MISRILTRVLHERANSYPIVTVTGPRQSGKTTLCRATFGNLAYVSLEPLDARDAVRSDPRGFLDEYRDGAVIDEVQHVPELLTYLQPEVDADPRPGRFIVTGSQHFGLLASVSQSLAGRTAVVHLLPLGLDEVGRFDDPPDGFWETLWMGGYPRIHDRKVPANEWLADYVTTYVERDVRQVLNIGDLVAFTQFVRLCAGRTATEVNFSSLGSDAGVSHNTARGWLSVLETGFLCFRAPAWRSNVRKQQIKAPKLHFFDSGLACSLLGITSPDQLRHHPLRGQLFESWVASEIYKAQAHRAVSPRLFHYRDAKGLEVDVVAETGAGLAAVEAKSGATVASDFLKPLQRFLPDAEDLRRILIVGGEETRRRGGIRVVSWRQIQSVDWV
ncbi:MAG: DUF4143 domain-containing protein [Luteitalea sp.]|nr:DUF4143 domain-containing protein [Luteitalea sp.]